MKKLGLGIAIIITAAVIWLFSEETAISLKDDILSFIIWAPVYFILGVAAIFSLAKADLFFTFVEEGSAKVVLKMGAFHRIIVQFKEHRINPVTYDVEMVPNLPKKIFGGLCWIGIPLIFTLHRYTFRWTTIRPQTGEILKRSEKLDFILLRDDVYAVQVKGAESKGMVPLDITILLTMCSVNPYKTLFRAQDWSEMIFNRSEATFREFVANLPFEEIVTQRQSASGELYKKLQSQGLLTEFINEYGVKVKAVEMKEICPTGAHAKIFEEAATKKWQAEREKERIETTANAEVNRIDKVYGKIQEYKELGMAVRFMESLDKAGEKPGNWIIPFGDVKTAIQGLIGNKNSH